MLSDCSPELHQFTFPTIMRMCDISEQTLFNNHLYHSVTMHNTTDSKYTAQSVIWVPYFPHKLWPHRPLATAGNSSTFILCLVSSSTALAWNNLFLLQTILLLIVQGPLNKCHPFMVAFPSVPDRTIPSSTGLYFLTHHTLLFINFLHRIHSWIL